MDTISFSQFPLDEQEDFGAACNGYHVSADAFTVFAEEEPSTTVGVAAIMRKVRVTHIRTATTREYDARGAGSQWTADFAHDLASGVFAI